jgi:hypothetical protein
MPVIARWYDDGETIRYWAFEGRWTWQEYFDTFEQTVPITTAKTHRVDTIFDVSLGKFDPPSILMTNFRSSARRRAPNVRLIVIIGGLTVKQIVTLFTKLQPENIYRYASSLEEALNIIASDRAQPASE